MTTLLQEHPSLTEFHTLISKVPSYPVSVRELIEFAQTQKTSKPVLDFYRSFPEDEIFEDQDDLMGRTENIEILRHQSAPKEEMHAPEED